MVVGVSTYEQRKPFAVATVQAEVYRTPRTTTEAVVKRYHDDSTLTRTRAGSVARLTDLQGCILVVLVPS